MPLVEPISPGQYFWLLAISAVAGGVYLWPAFILRIAGPNALFSLLLTMMVAAGAQALQAHWSRTTGRGPYALGLVQPWRGATWGILIIGTVLLLSTDVVLLALFSQLLKTFFYPVTPRLAIIVAMAAIAAWIGSRPLSTVARNVQFWAPFILLSFVLVVLLALSDVIFPNAITPSTAIYGTPIVRASVGTWFLYANGGVTASLVPFVRWRSTPRPVLVSVLAIGLQSAILLVLFWLVVATLGPESPTHLVWPIIYVLALVRVHGFFLEGLGLAILLIWTSAMVLYLSVHLFVLSWNLGALAKSGGHRTLALGMAAILALGAVLIPNPIMASQLLFGYVSPGDLGWTILVVPVTYVITRWRARKNVT
jgi:hypothetical protein